MFGASWCIVQCFCSMYRLCIYLLAAVCCGHNMILDSLINLAGGTASAPVKLTWILIKQNKYHSS